MLNPRKWVNSKSQFNRLHARSQQVQICFVQEKRRFLLPVSRKSPRGERSHRTTTAGGNGGGGEGGGLEKKRDPFGFPRGGVRAGEAAGKAIGGGPLAIAQSALEFPLPCALKQGSPRSLPLRGGRRGKRAEGSRRRGRAGKTPPPHFPLTRSPKIQAVPKNHNRGSAAG